MDAVRAPGRDRGLVAGEQEAVGDGGVGQVARGRTGHETKAVPAGGSGKSVYVNVPGAIVLAQRSPELNWRFQTVPQPHLNGRRIGVPRRYAEPVTEGHARSLGR